MPTGRLLTIIEQVLRENAAPMSARAIVGTIRAKHSTDIGGKTPWKTVGARLAVDIRRNPKSAFLRVGRGLYALREWPDVVEATVPERRPGPLQEEILAIPRSEFLEFIRNRHEDELFDADLLPLLNLGKPIRRSEAEKTEAVVQLIPSFVVLRGNQVLSYRRTKKTPESRLHDTRSIVFGGHLQADDIPTLFAREQNVMVDFLFRELHEELSIDPPVTRFLFQGIIYLEGSSFERQHAGILFILEAPLDATAKSLEPGYHSSLEFMSWDEVPLSTVMNDRWSAVCVRALNRGRSEHTEL